MEFKGSKTEKNRRHSTADTSMIPPIATASHSRIFPNDWTCPLCGVGKDMFEPA